MSNREWFAPKRYGFGAGMPISWQGWALSGVFIAAIMGSALLFKGRPAVVIAIVVPLIIGFTLITAFTTRGGWRWRWGGDE